MIVTVTGGKGGCGKSFIATSIAYLLSNTGYHVLLLDTDVDNPSTPYLLETKLEETREVYIFNPVIDHSRCIRCLKCVENCIEHALTYIPGKGIVFLKELCNGCGVCKIVCPVDAVGEGRGFEGYYRYYSTPYNIDLVTGEVNPGNPRTIYFTARLVEEHKHLFNRYDYVVIDSPPGSSARIYSVVKYAGKAVVVTEPTPLSISDLWRNLDVVKRYIGLDNILVVINKTGLSREKEESLKERLESESIAYKEIPYSRLVVESYYHGKPLPLLYPGSREASILEGIMEWITS